MQTDRQQKRALHDESLERKRKRETNRERERETERDRDRQQKRALHDKSLERQRERERWKERERERERERKRKREIPRKVSESYFGTKVSCSARQQPQRGAAAPGSPSLVVCAMTCHNTELYEKSVHLFHFEVVTNTLSKKNGAQ